MEKEQLAFLAELALRITAFRDARDWKQFHNPKDMALSLVLEATEVMEHFQWKNQKEMEEHLQSHKTEIGDELADVLYWVILMCHDFNINVLEALAEKMKKNEEKYPVDQAKGSHKKYSELSL